MTKPLLKECESLASSLSSPRTLCRLVSRRAAFITVSATFIRYSPAKNGAALQPLQTVRSYFCSRASPGSSSARAAEVDRAATKKLRKIRPTTVAGVMVVTAYFVEHIDRYPGRGWI